jgi:NTP pyrophosphatase (non-canonical NTP hydrolase)
MTIKEFDDFVRHTGRHTPMAGDGSLPHYATLGLVGEAGEVAELVKKAFRSGKPLDDAAGMMEVGDVAWYVTRWAHERGFTLEDVLRLAVMKLSRREVHGKDHAAELGEARVILGLAGSLV